VAEAKGGGKGGGTPSDAIPGAWSLADLDMFSDGRGAYVDGECGVTAVLLTQSDGERGSHFEPTGRSMTAEESAACGGPRSVTLVMASRHVSWDPHVDDPSDSRGPIPVIQAGFGLETGTGKVNAPPVCFLVARNGSVRGRGLRFSPELYPGSSSLDAQRTADGGYLLRTRPFPDNLGWCEENSGISLWHVEMEFTVRPTP